MSTSDGQHSVIEEEREEDPEGEREEDLEEHLREKADEYLLVMYEELKEASLKKARRYDLIDADNEAMEAVAHLRAKLPIFIEQVRRKERTGDLTSFRKWSHVVLNNRLLTGKRKQDATREVYTPDDDVLDRCATRVDFLCDEGVSLPDDPEKQLEQRDKLLILFLLILDLRKAGEKKYRQINLVLGKLSGFTRAQLEESLGYTRQSQTVYFARLVGNFAPFPEDLSRPPSRFDHPQNDPPLATRRTPELRVAMEALDGEPGTKLLQALLKQENPLHLHYYARLAGFWDCVVADGLEFALATHRNNVVFTRERLQNILSALNAGGPDQEVPRAPSGQGDGSVTPQQAKQRSLYLASTSHAVQRLARQAEEDPESSLAGLLADTDLQEALAFGRQQRQEVWAREAASREAASREAASRECVSREFVSREGVSFVSAALSLAESLWKKTVNTVDAATGWLVLQEAAAGALRSGSRPAAHGRPITRALAFGDIDPSLRDCHCLVWQLEGEDLRLVYPRRYADPTEGQSLAGRSLFVQAFPDGPPVRVVLVWTPVRPPREATKTARETEAALKRWVEQEVLAGKIEGCSTYRLEIA